MYLKSNSLKSKNRACKCANACLKNRFEAKGLIQAQSDKIKLEAQTERFRLVFETVLLKEIPSENHQMSFAN